MKFIDIHNHILPGIDDGFKSIDDTIEAIKHALNTGIDTIIATPHYKKGIYANTTTIINDKIKEINKILKDNNLEFIILPGCEIFLTKDSNSLLNSQEIHTLNNSSYILVEMHYLSEFWSFNLKEELYNLSVDGYKIILAHPERYEITNKNPNFIHELVLDGHYMQVNVNTLNPRHPNHKIARNLLDHNLVSFIASDAHNLDNRPLELNSGYEFIKKQYGEIYANNLFYDNPLRVIENKPIKVNNPLKIKTKKLFFIK